jgi:hypothetical protein
MNIVFDDKLSATCWHNLMGDPGHRDHLLRWITPFLWGAWSRSNPGDIPIRDPAETPPRPDWRGTTGHLSVLHIHTCSNDCYVDVDSETGLESFPTWFTGEFSWGVYSYPVDDYGCLPPRDQQPRDRAHLIIHGGLINHGSHTEPSWSSHT